MKIWLQGTKKFENQKRERKDNQQIHDTMPHNAEVLIKVAPFFNCVSISVEWVEYGFCIRSGEQVEHTGRSMSCALWI